MSEVTREVEVKLRAKDETANAFESAKRRAEEYLHGIHKNAKLVREALEIGGAAEIGLKAIEAQTEAYKTINEQLEMVSSGQKTLGRGAFDAANQALHSIPIIKEMTEAEEESLNMWGRLIAVGEQYAGVEKEIAENNFLNRNNLRAEAAAAAEVAASYSEIIAAVHGKHVGESMSLGIDKDIFLAKQAINDSHQAQFDALAKIQSESGPDSAKGIEAQRQAGELRKAMWQEQADAEFKIRRDASHQLEDEERQHGERLIQIDASIRAAVLQEAGLTAESQALTIAAKYDKTIKDIQTKAENDSRQHSERTRLIEAEALEEITALHRQQAEELHRIYEDDRRNRADEAQKAMDEVRSIYVAAGVARLKAEHRDAEAELFQLKQDYQRQIAEIDRLEKEKLDRLHQAGPDAEGRHRHEITDEANAKRGALKAKFEADTNLANKSLQERQRDQIEDAKHQQAQAAIGLLRAEAEAGNGVARQAAERLEIVSQTEAKIAEITKQMREQKDLQPEVRASLEDTIKLLRSQEAIGLATAGLHGMDDIHQPAPGENQGRGMIGLNAAMGVKMHNAGNERQQQGEAGLLSVAKDQVGLLAKILQQLTIKNQVFGGGAPNRNALTF